MCGAGSYDAYLHTSSGLNAGDASGAHNGHFWSYHIGGANFAMGDGSVRFLSNSMNYSTFTALSTRSTGEVTVSRDDKPLPPV
jgi:prepilin-type processing-associated H-X9-DG protein